MRFAGHVSDRFIGSYTGRDDWLQRTVLGAFADGELRGAAECRLLPGNWPQEAELAFSVEQSLQGRGIGSALFARMLTFARNRALQRVYLTTLAHNRRMRHIAGKFGMRLSVCDGDLEGRLELLGPDYVSLWEEAWQESHGWLASAWHSLLADGREAA
ncbi:GNAT family N-acetyltransferase [Arhodomonas sp. AD133]|uniref:GNAT family N-acetyltransferase n=1 Tax=Arhodomonas sp. AD133 TaxID=3415009 RepID=UPI003EBF2BE2